MPETIWPAMVLATTVDLFSDPGERVVLVPWPQLPVTATGLTALAARNGRTARLHQPGARVTRTASGAADLVITSVTPAGADPQQCATVSELAAELLRTGGVFAVLTHCDSRWGMLSDPTGTLIQAAQHCDLLYLQHLVALHAPIRDGRLSVEPPAPGRAPRGTATVPVHERIHSDVLIFTQPGD